MGPMYIMDAQRGIFGGPDGGVYLGPQRGIFRVPKRVYLGSKKCFFFRRARLGNTCSYYNGQPLRIL